MVNTKLYESKKMIKTSLFNILSLIILYPLFIVFSIHTLDYPQPYAPYYSQCGQDKYLVEKLFKWKEKGVFFDIGAHDGVSYSNTYYLEKELGWTGICVEPQNENYQKLAQNRNCICVHGCIFETSGEKTFLQVNGPSEMLSGLLETYESRHLQRAKAEVAQYGGSIELIKTMAYNFNELCEQHNLHHIDALSIDTEGSEERILRSIDFDAIDITALVVENNYGSTSTKEFLESKGYTLKHVIGYADEIYIKSIQPAKSTLKQYYCIAADERHYPHLKNLIGSIHHTNFEQLGEIAVFDLGLTPEQKNELQKIERVLVQDIEPVHPDLLKKILTDPTGRHVRGNFAWKPVVIKQALEHYPYVLYLDAGTTVLKNLTPIFEEIKKHGYFLLSCSNDKNCNIVDRITSYVLEEIVNKLPDTHQEYILDDNTTMIDAGLQGVSRSMLDSYVLPMYNYAHTMEYFKDDGSAKRGFGAGRHDQTLYSILAHNLNLTIYPEGFFDLAIGNKKHKAHIHWEESQINNNSLIYRSRWNLSFDGGRIQYIKYKNDPSKTSSEFRYKDFTESIQSCAIDGLNCSDFAKTSEWNVYTTLFEKNAHNTLSLSQEPLIPKKIHQIWLGSPLPDEFKSFCESWKTTHPGWEYKLWTDKDIEELNLENKALYDAATNYGERSDIARYEILYRFGGLYIDTDFESIKPMDILHHMFDFYTGYPGWCEPILNNGLIASSPNHPLLRVMKMIAQ